MTMPQAIVEAVHAAGGHISVDGVNIRLQAPKPLPMATLDLIKANKPALIMYLRQPAHGDIERTAIIEHEAGFPREWEDGFATLCTMPRPDAYLQTEWQQLIDDAGYFLDQWASQCSKLGWSLADVFGVALGAPQTRHDCKGLVPMLRGMRVMAVTSDYAVIQTRTGAH